MIGKYNNNNNNNNNNYRGVWNIKSVDCGTKVWIEEQYSYNSRGVWAIGVECGTYSVDCETINFYNN